jgi:mRNA interferase MazF
VCRSTRVGTSPTATACTLSDARRGEIWLIDLGEPIGHEQGWRRPALVVSSDHWNRHAATVTVLPLTRTQHGLPTRVEIEPDDTNGLDTTSYARCEDIRSISERRLVHRTGVVDPVDMARIGAVARRFLEF